MPKHRHVGVVTGATYDAGTGMSQVFRRCRCGARDTLQVKGTWWVRPVRERGPDELREERVRGMEGREMVGERDERGDVPGVWAWDVCARGLSAVCG